MLDSNSARPPGFNRLGRGCLVCGLVVRALCWEAEDSGLNALSVLSPITGVFYSLAKCPKY